MMSLKGAFAAHCLAAACGPLKGPLGAPLKGRVRPIEWGCLFSVVGAACGPLKDRLRPAEGAILRIV